VAKPVSRCPEFLVIQKDREGAIASELQRDSGDALAVTVIQIFPWQAAEDGTLPGMRVVLHVA
jgi:hypothetical protein